MKYSSLPGGVGLSHPLSKMLIHPLMPRPVKGICCVRDCCAISLSPKG